MLSTAKLTLAEPELGTVPLASASVQASKMSTAEAVIAEIMKAFPPKRPRSFQPIVNSAQSEEPLATAAAFADKDDWTALDSEWLDEAPDGWSSALSFLSDEAVCFYIPAYLVADLKGELERVEPAFRLTRGFDAKSSGEPVWPGQPMTWTHYAKERWSHLTTTQAAAIVSYLKWRAENCDGPDNQFIGEALESFWECRIAGA